LSRHKLPARRQRNRLCGLTLSELKQAPEPRQHLVGLVDVDVEALRRPVLHEDIDIRNVDPNVSCFTWSLQRP